MKGAIILRKHLKIATLLILLLTLSLSLSYYFLLGNPSALSEKIDRPKYNIHVVLKSYQSTPDFWRIVEQGVRVAEQEFDVECFITGPESENDVELQIEQLYQSIEQKPDAIVLAASDYNDLVTVCEKIREAGIELIIIDSDVNFSDRATIVSTDNYEIGNKLATLVQNNLAPDAKVGVIGHVESVSTAAERYAGFVENLPNANKRFVGIEYCDGSVEKARLLALEMMKEYPDLKCFVGLNETSSLGISYALQETGKAGEILHFACDSSERQIQFMENGTVQTLVVQNPFNMGYLSIEATVQLLGGKKIESQIFTNSVIITKEDMYKPENQKLLFPFTESRPEEIEAES